MGEKIGEFLVRIGEIDTAQAEIICGKQLSGDKRKFGEIARALRYINKDLVRLYLEAKKAREAMGKKYYVGKNRRISGPNQGDDAGSGRRGPQGTGSR
jgi:hypothetical protein